MVKQKVGLKKPSSKRAVSQRSRQTATQLAESIRQDFVGLTRQDGWSNALVGLASKRDKTLATQIDTATMLIDEQLEAMYIGDGLSAAIVDVMAEDMVQKWIDVETESEDDEERIEEVMKQLNVQEAFSDALKWARLYGGAMIIVGAIDGRDPGQPLNLNTLRRIDQLYVVDRSDISISQSEFQTDQKQENFGKALRYHVTFKLPSGEQVGPVKVHHTRCIPIFGKKIPVGMSYMDVTLDHRYWGISELQHSYPAIRDYGGSMQAITNTIYELIVSKFKIANLATLLASGQEQQIVNRVEIMSMAKSIINSLIYGDGEEFSRDSISLTGIAEVLDRMMMRVSASSKYPVTKLFGRSAAGMNATGEGDDNNYVSRVASEQETKLRPGVQYLLSIISRYLKIENPVSFEFVPVKQIDRKTQAEIEKLEADTAKIRADTYAIYVNDVMALTPDDVIAKEFPEKLGPQKPEGEPPIDFEEIEE